MKKFFINLSMILMLSLTGCGSDNEKAKELLQHILQLIGIPQSIVVNICQDGNDNGFCDAKEILNKITINKGDSYESILEKVKFETDGTYVLENYDPDKKILMEIVDNDTLENTGQRVTLDYNPKTKELSILQSLIDNGLLREDEVAKLKKSEVRKLVDEVLLENLFQNQTLLLEQNVSERDAKNNNLKYIAEGLQDINVSEGLVLALENCENNSSCEQQILKDANEQTEITPKEAKVIAETNSTKGTGDGSTTLTNEEQNATSSLSNFQESDYFITTWKTNNPGTSNDKQITIPTNGGGYNYMVDWGDGSTDTNVNGDINHTYANAGTYTVKIAGEFPQLFFLKNHDEDDSTIDNDAQKLLSIEQWGTINWKSMAGAFLNCSNLEGHATDTPNLANVTNMTVMFADASAFNQDISSWNVANVTDMSLMFFDASAFNQDISSWNVANVTDMQWMFEGASAFNQDIGSWNVANVTDIAGMFAGASSFNQNIGNWNVANVTNMYRMFKNASAFNQDIGSWNVANVTSMDQMFNNASAFNQNLENWNFEKVTHMVYMFNGITLSRQNYDALLISLHNQSLQSNVSFHAGNSQYSSAAAGPRNVLVSTFGWSITDGGQSF